MKIKEWNEVLMKVALFYMDIVLTAIYNRQKSGNDVQSWYDAVFN